MLLLGIKNNSISIFTYLLIVHIPMLITYYFAKDLGLSSLWLYFICLIGAIRIAFFKDSFFKGRLDGLLFGQLQKHYGRSPSKTEIVKAMNLSLSIREYIFFINLIIVLVLSAYFKQF